MRARWAGRPNFAPKTQFSPCHPLHEAAPLLLTVWSRTNSTSRPVRIMESQVWVHCWGHVWHQTLHCSRIHGSHALRSLGSTPAVPFRLLIFGPQSLDSEPAMGTLDISVFSLCYLPPPPLPPSTPASLTKERLQEAPKSRRGPGQRPRGMPQPQPAAPALRLGSETHPHEKWAPGLFHVQITGTYFFLRTNFFFNFFFLKVI